MVQIQDVDAYPLIEHPKQRAFLLAYPKIGTINGTSRAVTVNPSTVWRWMQDDSLFMQAFAVAKKEFCDELETLALERVRAQGPQHSPLLLITLLNANLPDKYKPQTVIMDTGAKDVLKKLDQLAGKGKDQTANETEVDPVMAFARLRKGTTSPPKT